MTLRQLTSRMNGSNTDRFIHSMYTITEASIIYEDNHLIAINKASGALIQGDKSGDIPLTEAVKEFLKKKYNKPGAVYLGLVHRLDRPVSGLVLFAKTDKALTRLNRMFQERTVQKTYWAIVSNRPDPFEGKIKNYLRKNTKQNKSYTATTPKDGAKLAELSYKLMMSTKQYHLLEVKPVTGRHHQIRAQLAGLGCPIKGDLKYGAERSNKDGYIHLHARQLELIHPVKKTPLKLVASIPADENLWATMSEPLN